jgi:tetratricopeptide (TPR) repeat protein
VRTQGATGLALALFLLGGRAARADDGAQTDAPVKVEDKAEVEAEVEAEAEAREHFARGTTHFNLGEFEAALTEFRAAYSLSLAPGLLFNMAQSCRAARNYRMAEHYYRVYLRLAPDAADRGYVEARLQEMANAPPAAPPAGPAAARTQQAVPPVVQTVDVGRPKRIIGIATAGVGVALLATAALFAREAGSAADEVSQAFRDGGAYDEDLAATYARGRRDERIAIAGASLGTGLVIGGAIIWYLGVRDAAHVHVAPAPGGAEVVMSWTF